MSFRFVAVFAMLIAAAGVVSSVAPAAAANTCFGRAATVVPDGNAYYLTAGNDVVVGTGGDDYVSNLGPGAAGGTDYICTRGGNDEMVLLVSIDAFIDAGSGSDRVFPQGSGTIDLDLGSGNDYVTSFDVAGTVRGGSGNDSIVFSGVSIIPGTVIYGDSGNDYIQSAAAELVYGGSGNDTIIDFGNGATLVDCGSGRDVFDAPNAVTVRRCERPYY